MILLAIILISLVGIYFTRLLSRRNMKVATLGVAILYSYIIAWIYSVFILDIADLGFSEVETRISLLHGSDIYHSFMNITDKMNAIPLELLEAIVLVALFILIAAFSVAFHGIFEITRKALIAASEKHRVLSAAPFKRKASNMLVIPWSRDIIRLYCKMNC